jgi:hypothetical protein
MSEVRLWNSPLTGVLVNVSSSGWGYFPSDQGPVYHYRIYTTLTTPFIMSRGETIRLNDIDTNNCGFALAELRLLSTPRLSVQPVCMGPGVFQSNDGRVFPFRVQTTVYVNY